MGGPSLKCVVLVFEVLPLILAAAEPCGGFSIDGGIGADVVRRGGMVRCVMGSVFVVVITGGIEGGMLIESSG